MNGDDELTDGRVRKSLHEQFFGESKTAVLRHLTRTEIKRWLPACDQRPSHHSRTQQNTTQRPSYHPRLERGKQEGGAQTTQNTPHKKCIHAGHML